MKIRNYAPEVLGVLAGIGVLNLWYLSGLVVSKNVVPVTYTYILNGIIAVSGAFFGAASAFYFNNRRDTAREKMRCIESLNQALFTSLQQINALSLLKRHIEPFESDPCRYINLGATYAKYKFDFKLENLNFILSLDPTLVMDITIEQGRFDSAVAIFNMRSDFHSKELQVVLSDSGFAITNPSEKEVVDCIGPRMTYTAIKLTNEVYEHVYESVESAKDLHKRLYQFASDAYPEEYFVQFKEQV
ncbi:TPA: hypothetical protein NKZ44_004466 [Vibrio parahaemolyticus]|nr:hypothetical protein [Vibrio parahaemolyticus]HCH6354445.1 hypothetical protein [Vibrio parahaemolyticus]